jgi:formamidopyrimidine-DNA glycosylase
MPELPEVEVIARELRSRLVGRRIVDVETDWPKYFRLPKTEEDFRACVKGRRIEAVDRRAKYILIRLSGHHLLLVHQKISGRLQIGRWLRNPAGPPRGSRWQPATPGDDAPRGRFIHLIFELDNGDQLGLSDLRKFAKVMCGPEHALLNLPEVRDLGPEPLSPKLTFPKFERLFLRKKGAVKQVLMEPTVIAGIGNLYSDEILYAARLHPLTRVEHLKAPQLRSLYRTMRAVLRKAIRLGATGQRAPDGSKRGYDRVMLVYGREGQCCPRGHVIERIKVGGRSAHFCPVEQLRSSEFRTSVPSVRPA